MEGRLGFRGVAIDGWGDSLREEDCSQRRKEALNGGVEPSARREGEGQHHFGAGLTGPWAASGLGRFGSPATFLPFFCSFIFLFGFLVLFKNFS
jgi:hypothetical protein